MANNIPLAVAPSVRSPGLYLAVDLKSGAPSPGSAALRAVLIAPKTSSGTITVNTELAQSVSGEAEAAVLGGAGSLLHLGARRFFEENPLGTLDVVAPILSGTAATGTLTFAGTPTGAWSIDLRVKGVLLETYWAAGESATVFAARARDAVNAAGDRLPVTAASVAGALNFTAKAEGAWGNDVKLQATIRRGGTGTAPTVDAAATITKNLTGGVGEPDLTIALSLIAGREYDKIIPGLSNADVTAGTNTGRIRTHVIALGAGASAKLQSWIAGHTATIANAKTASAALNHELGQAVYCQQAQSLPVEWACAEAGARMREIAIDPAVNRIQARYLAELYGPTDRVADELNTSEVEDLLQSGVTPVTFDSTGTPRPDRPITTYFLTETSAPDDRVLDTSVVDGTFAVARDLRSFLPAEFPQQKILPAMPQGEDLPDGVITVSEIKLAIDSRVQGFWIPRGVVRGDRWRAARDAGTFIVRVNPSDNTQVDVVTPFAIVPPLAKFSLVVQHRKTSP